MNLAEQKDRIDRYLRTRGLTAGKCLGFGVHGSVFDAENQGRVVAAVEAHRYEEHYRIEREAYLRLFWHGKDRILGFNVPTMIEYDDALWVIEMTVVTRPFALDFAGGALDAAPPERGDMLEQMRETSDEHFGANWARVEGFIQYLEGLGIFLIDVNPRNISFGE